MLTLLVFGCLMKPSYPFASWFVDRQSSCWIDIRDPSEVVMNQYIVPFAQSSHPNVLLQVYKFNDNDVDAKQNKEDNYSFHVESSHSTSSEPQTVYMDQHYNGEISNSIIMEYLVKLKVDDEELKDLQYVMDVMVTPEVPEDEEEVELTKSQGEQSRIQARFLSSYNNIGCGDKRIHGRGNENRGAKLQIIIPLSIFDSENDINEHSVDLVAGWACGHEAVTLTQSIVFRPQTSSLSSSSSSSSQGRNDVKDQNKKSDTIGNVVRQPPAETLKARKKEFEEKYNKDTFGKAKFTAKSFLTGLVVLLFVGGSIVNALVALTSNRKSAYSMEKTS
eukprot:CAMPEP_0176498516 /NCGR_PEP_ID=MMETSP0200_2-20121128/12367_1 /TAXON_ID=947934 /ORGANISM="Chaetoceros sp., Strain GSL56" /LENGTH=332 /DNA_ID=CAMNT_0017896737 /DNA_START=96 /DNA_END=1094 /DNA_ORIENTATION=-